MSDHPDLTGGPFCSCISCHLSLDPPPSYALVITTEDDALRSPLCEDCARKARERLATPGPDQDFAVISWPPPDAPR